MVSLSASRRVLPIVLLIAVGCAHAPRQSSVQPPPETSVEPARPPAPAPSRERRAKPVAEGMASWYGDAFRGRLPANGERFTPSALTAAPRTLPFGTCL